MELQKLTEACWILQSYHPGNDDYWNVAADHDEIYLPGLPPHQMTDDDVLMLNVLGWEWVEAYDAWRHYL